MLENVDQFTDNQRHQAVQHVARGDGGRIIFTEKLGGKICQPVIFLRAEYQIIIVGGLVVQRFDKKGGEIIVLSDALEKGCIQVFSGNQEIDEAEEMIAGKNYKFVERGVSFDSLRV